MDLSIIVPCHNLENYIIPLLGSLNEQEIENYEVELIFVCDGCTDNTEDIIISYPFSNKQIKSIQVYRTSCCACGLARNEGLAHARGTYIWFIDGDDWLIDDRAIEVVLNVLNFTEEPVVRFDYNAPSFKSKGIDMMVWQYVFRRDFIGDTRFLPIQPHEDTAFMKAVLPQLGRKTVLYLDKQLYFYNFKRPGSNMTQFLATGHINP